MRNLLRGAAALGILALVVTTGPPSAAAASGDNATPLVSQSVVVNEVATTGPDGPLDEFVEIRNVSPNLIDLSQYQVLVYNSANQVVGTVVIPDGIVLAPKGSIGQFLVLEGQDFSGTTADPTNVLPLTLPNSQVGIPDNGGVAIMNAYAIKVDGVGFSQTAATPREGTAAVPQNQLTAELGAASARDLLSTDTDNNRLDFSLHARTPGAVN